MLLSLSFFWLFVQALIATIHLMIASRFFMTMDSKVEATQLSEYLKVTPEDMQDPKSLRSPRLFQAFGEQRLTNLAESIHKSIAPTLDDSLLAKQQASWQTIGFSGRRWHRFIRQEPIGSILTRSGSCTVLLYFGEASVLVKPPHKYGGDTGVFRKNSHDMIDNLTNQGLPLLLFNIDGLVLQALILDKVQDVYPMTLRSGFTSARS
ncbi:hypothetical protein B0O80DRAFT_423021 [Mortierella sp. GBAus27b]|nr:hypothetical protein B0O80DRAFT_423021 [Mortierella sp. GBAus27b]